MPYFNVKYYAGAFNGLRTVHSKTEEAAIEKVKTQLSVELEMPVENITGDVIDDDDDVYGSEED